MKLAFTYPAKIIFAERNIEMTPVSFGGLEFFTGPINKNIWFCTKTEKIKVTDYTGREAFHVYVKIEDCLLYCACIEPAYLTDWLENKSESVKENFDKWRNYILNPEIWEQEQADKRAKIKEERARADAEKEKRNRERAENLENLYKQSLKSFKSGQKIQWDHFERALKENNINLPIKTLGFGRKWIIDIGVRGATTRGKCHNSPVIWQAVRKLHSGL